LGATSKVTAGGIIEICDFMQSQDGSEK